MSKEQPEALRLADEISSVRAPYCGAAAAELRRLHDELKECQDQRRASFRRIEELDRELDAMRAQIGQGKPQASLVQQEPLGFMNAGHVYELQQKRIPYAYLYSEEGSGAHVAIYTHPAPQQQPLTDEQDRALCEAYCNAASDEYFKARPQLDSSANRRIFYAGHRKAWIEWQAAHNIGEKK